MPLNYDAVLFDLDGTLWHFDDAPPPEELALALAPRFESLITSWGQRSSIPYAELDLALLGIHLAADERAHEQDNHRSPDYDVLTRSVLATYGVDATLEQARAVHHLLKPEVSMLRPRLFDGALETIDALRTAGARLAAVTNRSHSAAALDDELHHHGLTSHFSAIVTAADAGRRKPHPAPVEQALAALDVAPQRALMVGDTPNRDIAAARAAGVTSVLITHPGRPVAVPAGPDEHPQHTITSLTELVVLVAPTA